MNQSAGMFGISNSITVTLIDPTMDSKLPKFVFEHFRNQNEVRKRQPYCCMKQEQIPTVDKGVHI